MRRREATMLAVLLVCGLSGATFAGVEGFKDYDRMTSSDDYYRTYDQNYNGVPDDCESGRGRRFSRTSPWNRPRWQVIPTAGNGVQTSACVFPRVLADTSRGLYVRVVHSPGDTTAPVVSILDSDRRVIEVRTAGGRHDRLTNLIVAPGMPWPIGKAYVLIVIRQDSLWGEVNVRATKARTN